MQRSIIPRELVARELAISTRILIRYESLGLIHTSREGPVEGYEPATIRRIWRILSFQRDLGINLAGVEVLLRLCDRMSELHRQLGNLAGELGRLAADEDEIDISPTGAHRDE